jgi:uncharacterized membrane protein
MVTVVYFLHVLLAFAAIAFLVVPGLMLELAARTKDVRFIRRSFMLGSFHGRVGGIVALLTAIVGFAVAWKLGIPLNAGWLIAGYVVFVVLLILGFGYHARREIRIGRLAQASPNDAPSPELIAAVDDPMAIPIFWASGILWILLIWLMVARPI